MAKETIAKYCCEYLENEAELARLKGRQEAIKQKLLQELTADNQPNNYKITQRNVDATTVFDSNLFRSEHADLYNQYKTKERAGYTAIKIVAVKLKKVIDIMPIVGYNKSMKSTTQQKRKEVTL